MVVQMYLPSDVSQIPEMGLGRLSLGTVVFCKACTDERIEKSRLESVILMSIYWPAPVASLERNASKIPMLACKPAVTSPIGVPKSLGMLSSGLLLRWGVSG